MQPPRIPEKIRRETFDHLSEAKKEVFKLMVAEGYFIVEESKNDRVTPATRPTKKAIRGGQVAG